MEAVYQSTDMLAGAATADVLRLLQEAASQHQTALGLGREEMRRRGLLWMIASQKLTFVRQPVCGESVTVTTWLSQQRHGMYLRHYEISGTDGGLICRAAAVWTLADAENRTQVQMPFSVPLSQKVGQLPRFPLLRPMETEREFSFTVPVAYLDENDHMNNACYLDMAASILPQGGSLQTAQVDYHLEARGGECLTIGSALQGKNLLVQGYSARGLCFRMKLEYA